MSENNHFLCTFGLGPGQFCIAVINLTERGAFIYARRFYIPSIPLVQNGQHYAVAGQNLEPVSESWFVRVNAPENEDEMWDVVGHFERDAPPMVMVGEDARVHEGVGARGGVGARRGGVGARRGGRRGDAGTRRDDARARHEDVEDKKDGAGGDVDGDFKP